MEEVRDNSVFKLLCTKHSETIVLKQFSLNQTTVDSQIHLPCKIKENCVKIAWQYSVIRQNTIVITWHLWDINQGWNDIEKQW